jgi:hypothetical protein
VLASPLRETLLAFCAVTASGTGYSHVHAHQRVRHQLTQINTTQLMHPWSMPVLLLVQGQLSSSSQTIEADQAVFVGIDRNRLSLIVNPNNMINLQRLKSITK